MTGQPPDGLWVIGTKMYGLCARCNSVVRANKRIFGGAHICVPDPGTEQCQTAAPAAQTPRGPCNEQNT